MTKEEEHRRMQAALRNILETSSDEFSLSQARYGLGVEKCYLCRERDAVGKFLNASCCRECVQSISFS